VEAEMSIEAMKQALEALGIEREWQDGPVPHLDAAIAALRAAIEQAEKPKYDPIELHVLHSHIAGVLFDFMGWLTSREKRLTLSSTDEAGPAVEAITEFAKMRGLHLEDAQVEHWQAILTTPPAAPRQWVGLTNKDIIEMWPETSTVGWDDIRLIEAKLKEKNA
jgi:hypothetical protein